MAPTTRSQSRQSSDKQSLTRHRKSKSPGRRSVSRSPNRTEKKWKRQTDLKKESANKGSASRKDMSTKQSDAGIAIGNESHVGKSRRRDSKRQTSSQSSSSKERNLKSGKMTIGSVRADSGEELRSPADHLASVGDQQSRVKGHESPSGLSSPRSSPKKQRGSFLYRYLFLEPSKKAVLYIAIVVIGSSICDLTTPPKTYFSDKNNVFNQYFVKLSWGWTCGVAMVFLLPASYIVRNGDVWKMAKDLMRLVVGTVEWYCWVELFFWIEDMTGGCSGGGEFTNKRSCVRNGHDWDGYDISGHTFLLTHCALLISEELCYYVKLASRSKSKTQLKKKPYLHMFINVMFLIMTLLCLLWEFMLVCTQVYFHTTSHKVVALTISLVTWYTTYRVLYNKVYPDLHSDNRKTGKTSTL